ncbi:hypothetical protein F4825DRAFT_215318 [Nemania diffusa]|nr:hypothetical protein F4825DRAFT_215318 [Nemania diffusa]
MADRAPGYEQAAEDLQCYNCGMRGHMFFACPEDTRRVPAGLEASRKRQASASDHHASIKRGRGPVVTHYPPPRPLGLPHIPPPPTIYSSGLGYEGFHNGPPSDLPTGPPYHQPPPPGQYGQYQPSSAGAGRSASRGLSYDNSRDAYEHHFPGAPRVPPPETLYRPSHYDQYDQPRSAPSPSAPYGRPYSAPPDRHDEHPPGLLQSSPYASIHRTPLQASFEHYPPAPGVDNYYPSPPQPYPPPPLNVHRNSSHTRHDDTSPARLYTSGRGSPPPGTYSHQPHQYPPPEPSPYPARYDDRFADRSSYEPQRGDTHSQHGERRSGRSRPNRERYGRRMRYSSPKGRSHSERRFLDSPRISSPVNLTPPARSARGSAVPESTRSQQSPSNALTLDTKSPEKYTAEDFSWEEEMIFKELPVKLTRDLIWEPLPIEWTDDPIMPPKYDKETITSRYINPTNVDDFALSIRDTKAWQTMQYHPAFLSPTDVRIERLWDYEKALNPGPIYNKQSRYSVNSSGSRQRGKPWGLRARGGPQSRYSQHYGQDHSSTDDQSNYFRSGSTKRSWDQTSPQDAGASERRNKILGKKPKISSPEPGEVCETDDQPTSTKSTSPSWEQDYHDVHQGHNDHTVNALQDSRASPPDVTSESSGGGSSLHAPSTPPRRPAHATGSPSRISSIRSSRGAPTKRSSRHSLRSNASRESSRHSSIGSPLTPNERELLGMGSSSSGSDSGRDSPTPQANDASARSRQRPAKLHAAYQRRW